MKKWSKGPKAGITSVAGCMCALLFDLQLHIYSTVTNTLTYLRTVCMMHIDLRLFEDDKKR